MKCDEEYIGESSRTFGERFREHLKPPSPIYGHCNITGHTTSLENFSIVGREDQNLVRQIKEAVYIRVNSQSLNKNIGKYYLPHILAEVLLNLKELKLNSLTQVANPSATMAITSSIKRHFIQWLFHLPQNSRLNICQQSWLTSAKEPKNCN